MSLSKAELLAQIQQLKKELKVKRNKIKKADYGLVWLDVPETFEHNTENKLPILEEVKDKSISNDDGKPTHILIEGDNYHALTCLNYTHKEKVDLIYIDPPYNTGSDGFIYKDKRVLSKYPDGTEVPVDHPLRHSYWLSFMAKRLELAKSLLKQTGVIHISIDDNEYAQLKLLCDEIFGSKNFVATMIWQQGKKHIGSFIGVNHEYMLIYAKDKSFINDNNKKWQQKKKGLDRIYKEYKKLKKEFKNDYESISNRLKKFYKSLPESEPALSQKHYCHVDQRGIYFPDNISQGTGNGPRYDLIHPISKKSCTVPEGGWRYKEETMKKLLSENRIHFGEDETKVPNRKRYLKETEYELPPSVFYKDGRGATSFVKNILGSKKFNNPKDTEILKRMFSFKDNQVILDFFAGSGSTAQAVMELNEEDNGNRQWILVTNNENNIMDEVCYPRLKKVMSGFKLTKTNHYKALGNSFHYYKTGFVGRNNILSASDEDKATLSNKAGYLLAIAENTLDEVEQTNHFQFFKSNDINTAIYFQEDLSELDDFVNKVEKLENPTTVYLFSWGNKSEFESMFEHIPNINIKTIPQPILEIYKKIYYINN